MAQPTMNVVKDFLSSYQIQKFNELLGTRILRKGDIQQLNICEHLLFFNPIKDKLDKDGYFSYQSPAQVMNSPNLTYRRRLWAQGEIVMYRGIELNRDYICKENIKYMKRLRDDYFVCMERKIYDCDGNSVAKELRTLAYSNTLANDQYVTGDHKSDTNNKLVGTFIFNEMDIINYGHLSLNSHRIHWDRNYCINNEGYRDIIVQGPFAVQIMARIAQNLLDKNFTKIKYKNTHHIYPNKELQIYLDNSLPSDGNKHRLLMKSRQSVKPHLEIELTC